jgi:hypothetical protein
VFLVCFQRWCAFGVSALKALIPNTHPAKNSVLPMTLYCHSPGAIHECGATHLPELVPALVPALFTKRGAVYKRGAFHKPCA